MITDLIDVEPLLDQHDPGVILVSPLLSLSINANYRYFYIAGKGSKVYDTISLGFVEVETNAQTQRTDFITKLESRFAEVLTFGSLLEMARAVDRRWQNEETAKFLAFAELEAKPKPTQLAGRQAGIDDNAGYVGAAPNEYSKQRVVAVAPEPVDHAKDSDAISTQAPPLVLDQAQPMPVSRPVQMPSGLPIASLSQPPRGDHAVTEPQRHSGLSEDDIASVILSLRSPAKLGADSKLPVESARSSVSILLRFCIGGSVVLVAALVAWAIVRPPVPAPSISVSPDKEPSQIAAAMPPSSSNQPAEANELALQTAPAPPAPARVPASPPSQPSSVQVGAAPVAAPPSPPSSVQVGAAAPSSPPPSVQVGAAPVAAPPPSSVQVGAPPVAAPPPSSVQVGAAPVAAPSSPPPPPSVQVEAAPASASPSPPAQPSSTARRLDPEEIATLVNRGTDFMKSGDLASARLLLRRAAEAGSASAALMLGTTYDPLVIQQLGTVGVVSDVAQARRWYEKAAALGSDAASERLAKLPQTGR